MMDKRIDRPMVSVIMTTLNSARFVEQAVNSILAQTYQHWELLIVDGGSSDGTFAILQKYSDPRIHLFPCDGLKRSAQLNYAMQKASGEFIAIMDSDDISLPKRLALEYQYLQNHPEITIVGTWGQRIDEAGEIRGLLRTPIHHDDILENMMTPLLIIFSSVMFRKQLCAVLFDEKIKKNVDIEWYLRISSLALFANIPVPLFQVRDTRGSLSRNVDVVNNALLTAAFEHTCILNAKNNVTDDERYLLNLWQGIVHYYYGSPPRAKQFLLRAIQVRWTRILAWRYYLPLLLPPSLFSALRKNKIAYAFARGIRRIQLMFFKSTEPDSPSVMKVL